VGALFTAASFDIPLKEAPIPVYVKAGAPTPEHCSGSAQEPGAEAGYLCVFADKESNLYPGGQPNPRVCPTSLAPAKNEECSSGTTSQAADATGFGLYVIAEQGGLALGTWAVTAE
jgi:hypothetical protein